MVQAITRLPNWQKLLSEYMQIANTREGEWGTFDCAMNCADAVLAITNVDIGAQFRGQYHTEEESEALLLAHGFKNTAEIAASFFETDVPANGFSGDLAAFQQSGHDIVGVIYKSRIFTPAVGRRGMWSAPLSKAQTVFRVGKP